MGAGAEQLALRDGAGSAPHGGGGSGGSCPNGTSMCSAASTLRLATCLPNALERIEEVLREGRRVVLFLDYDGTLSPIVDDPDRAFLPEATRQVLREVASRYTTAIVTGRSKGKIMSFVKLSNVVYAGSHGFDIDGKLAGVGDISHRVAFEYRPSLVAAKTDMEKRLRQYAGASVEDNTLSVSFHYRKCEGDQIGAIESFVNGVAKQHDLALTRGKMVFELRPRVAWNKGKAVEYLLKAMKMDGEDVLPIYVGDDLTDEDAFKVLRGRGVSVIVAETHSTRLTVADLRVNDPSEVRQLLLYFARRQHYPCTALDA
ncbi:putative trehalose-phosphate phosphatase 7 [Gracilariopsis chorda]|uniref:Trehalose 6-phosphate phosphatase n=1 Tax=Gracilariopsis chorda TaxID=448386 RepID=A0A2V3IF58_9FLOR|nr:putative trehalose-phosphate phosphatase 7 [Gracilariopsis chorda]|eukprot:PXF39830.1 putative trehalose-phosphate phosphatase 7 [Gracilariopsis chorda]